MVGASGDSRDDRSGCIAYPFGRGKPAERASRAVRADATVSCMPSTLDHVRYETLPFGSAEREAAELTHPLTLTVTCSPKHGNDHTLEVAARLRALGHTVVCHLATRMVSSPEHLDRLLAGMRAADLHDVFLVGGDHPEPLGPYARALDLLPVLREHPDAPRTIGVTAYPEGHPMIAADVLADDLRLKAPYADYMVTQMCFHADALVRWLEQVRGEGVSVPAVVGLPGIVDRKRLLEISVKVGVGASISFLRKQHGIGKLALRSHSTAEQLLAEVAPLRGGALGVAGFHFFTFNRILDTVAFYERNGLSEPGEVVTVGSVR